MWSSIGASNIALIKYMGKKEQGINLPANSSLSWTLKHLTTSVEIKKSSLSHDEWKPLETNYPFKMSSVGEKKYLNHLQRVKDYFGVQDNFVVSSGNNFPADCGIASSASSFAALTDAACKAMAELSGKTISVEDKAKLSAMGSGSSCRSFFDGWVLWSGESVEPVKTQIDDLHHMVVIVGAGTKKVSSSEAHKIVKSSSLFPGRIERAEERLKKFLNASQELNWPELYQIGWEEFWDMHMLFETSQPHFGYFLPETLTVLNQVRDFWNTEGDGPLVTMDAGPNIHLLWRLEQRDLALKYFEKFLKSKFTCLSNLEGVGFAKI